MLADGQRQQRAAHSTSIWPSTRTRMPGGAACSLQGQAPLLGGHGRQSPRHQGLQGMLGHSPHVVSLGQSFELHPRLPIFTGASRHLLRTSLLF